MLRDLSKCYGRSDELDDKKKKRDHRDFNFHVIKRPTVTQVGQWKRDVHAVLVELLIIEF